MKLHSRPSSASSSFRRSALNRGPRPSPLRRAPFQAPAGSAAALRPRKTSPSRKSAAHPLLRGTRFVLLGWVVYGMVFLGFEYGLWERVAEKLKSLGSAPAATVLSRAPQPALPLALPAGPGG